jgi:hypothetical protein
MDLFSETTLLIAVGQASSLTKLVNQNVGLATTKLFQKNYPIHGGKGGFGTRPVV